MRKQAQDEKKNTNKASISPSSSNCSSSSANSPVEDFRTERNELLQVAGENKIYEGDQNMIVYSMDEIWKEVESTEEIETKNDLPAMASNTWDYNYCPDSIWMSTHDHYYFDNHQDFSFFTG